MTDAPRIPFFDGHNDTLLRLYRPAEDSTDTFFQSREGHIDLPRARAGGLIGGFFAVYVPNDPEQPDVADDELPPAPRLAYAQRYALGMMATLFRIERESQGSVRVVRGMADLTTAISDGAVAAILHMEGADAIDPDLDALEVFYQAGLRSLGLVWSRPNIFGEGVPFRFPHGPDTGPGLSDAGKRLVRECNRLGILVDLSHLNERGFWDVAEISSAPLVATHSNAHAVCPSPRNLTDRQLDAIRASGGMVGVNLHVGFLRPDGRSESATPLDVVVDHFDYLIEKLGVEHVGLGSDFDGARMPDDLSDASKLPNLTAALRQRGYSDADIHNLAHANWLRVLQRTWHSA
ncbi:MAG TPA: dipeptidase [Roseiflexaceae bacterium]|nr:dipeptidase [Roseiflexaceae bacterium]HMP41603.1 dipeptidase [Roseiflexaceae bacterium]